MKNSLSAILMIAAMLLIASDTFAQSTGYPANNYQPPSYQATTGPSARNLAPPPTQASGNQVGYRMADWKTIHGGSPAGTGEAIATLEQLGCEVNRQNHGDHEDIQFRCANWRSLRVDNSDQSAQWQQWLANNDFETIVLNPGSGSQLHLVELRLTNVKTIHAGSQQEAASAKEMYELLGCEAQVAGHADHFDVQIRCPNWTTVGLPNDHAAHVWQDFLNQTGFETQHEHAADVSVPASRDYQAGFRTQNSAQNSAQNPDNYGARTFASENYAGQSNAGRGPELIPASVRPNLYGSDGPTYGGRTFAGPGYGPQNNSRAPYGASYPGAYPQQGPYPGQPTQSQSGSSGCGHAGCNHNH